MNSKTTISFKSTNTLIERVKKQENIEILKEGNFFNIFFSKKKYADVYFHTGNLDENQLKILKILKLQLLILFASMNQIIAKQKFLMKSKSDLSLCKYRI